MMIRRSAFANPQRAQRFSHYRLFVPTLAAMCFAGGAVHAAPITFAFNGMVSEVDKSSNATFDLPFTVAVGDPLSGLLTLEPVSFGDKGLAPSLELSLVGSTFRATSLPVTTYNDVFVGSGFHMEGPLDEISVGCSDSPSGCSMLTSSAQGAPLTDMGMGFKAGDVANNGEQIAQSGFLNGFGGRQAALVFGSIFNGGSITIYASFGLMQPIPEPISSVLMAIGFSVCAVFRGRRLSDRAHKIEMNHRGRESDLV
jgi:hypothetical protein